MRRWPARAAGAMLVVKTLGRAVHTSIVQLPSGPGPNDAIQKGTAMIRIVERESSIVQPTTGRMADEHIVAERLGRTPANVRILPVST